MLAPYIRLCKESSYLWKLSNRERFARWKPNNSSYVALKAIKAFPEDEQQQPESVLKLLRNQAKSGEPMVLIGEPGAGKTTVLEAIVYELARPALLYCLLCWLIILITSIVFFFYVAPYITAHSLLKFLSISVPIQSDILAVIVWMLSFFLWEPLIHRWKIPLFIEARAHYSGSDIYAWIDLMIDRHIGKRSSLLPRNRVLFIIDGVNEIQTSQYESFIEGWRGLIQEKIMQSVIFTSRTGESPDKRLHIGTVVKLCNLDDAGVKEFLRVYGKRRHEGHQQFKAYEIENAFLELRRNGLLDSTTIGRNPYWLKMFVVGNIYTRNRGQLFLRFTTKLLEREIDEKPEERKRKPFWRLVPIDIEMTALAQLALSMHLENRIGYIGLEGWRKAHEVIDESIGETTLRSHDVLEEAVSASLLNKEYKGRIEFVHHLIQEFFAAYAIYQSKGLEKVVSNRIGDIFWWQTFFLLGGLLIEGKNERLEYDFQDYVLHLMNQNDESAVFVVIGMLQCVDKPLPEISQEVLNKFLSSVSFELTEVQIHAVRELSKMIGSQIEEVFDELMRTGLEDSAEVGMALFCALSTPTALDKVKKNLVLEPIFNKSQVIKIITKVGVPALKLIREIALDDSHDIRLKVVKLLAHVHMEESLNILLTMLKDPIESVRIAVIQALGEHSNTMILQPLMEMVGTDSPAVSNKIVKVLDACQTNEMIEEMAKLYSGMGKISRNALQPVLKSRGAHLIEQLIDILKETLDSQEYAIITNLLIDINPILAIDSIINNLLNDSDWRVLKNLFDDIGLIQNLNEEFSDIEIKIESNEVLADLRERFLGICIGISALPEVFPMSQIKEVLTNSEDKSGSVAVVMIGALVAICRPTIEPLIAGLTNQKRSIRMECEAALDELTNIDYIMEALEFGAEYANEEFLNRMLAICETRNDWYKDAAPINEIPDLLAGDSESKTLGIYQILFLSFFAGGLKNWWNNDLDRPLFKTIRKQLTTISLENGNVFLREGACLILGELENKHSVQPLMSLLTSRGVEQRLNAIEKLGLIGESRPVPALNKMLFEKNKLIRYKAAKSLGQIGDNRAVRPLIRALDDKDKWVRKASLKSLGQIGDNRAVRPLIRALDDKDKWIRNSAVKSLGLIGDISAIADLKRVSNDSNEWIARNALKSLLKLEKCEAKNSDLTKFNFKTWFEGMAKPIIRKTDKKSKCEVKLKSNSVTAQLIANLPHV